jgi:catechol 2,3-dioxygenase-like lactoylglutathione lyase family enzyme
MIKGFDHVALPMEHVDEMLSFYGGIGADIREEVPNMLHAAYLGSNKINLHMPRAWQSPKFELRGPNAVPGCGDLCFAWDGTMEDLQTMLSSAGAEIIEGPVERKGGLKKMGSSVYVRDPDQNLLEFMVYEESA